MWISIIVHAGYHVHVHTFSPGSIWNFYSCYIQKQMRLKSTEKNEHATAIIAEQYFLWIVFQIFFWKAEPASAEDHDNMANGWKSLHFLLAAAYFLKLIHNEMSEECFIHDVISISCASSPWSEFIVVNCIIWHWDWHANLLIWIARSMKIAEVSNLYREAKRWHQECLSKINEH